MLVHICKTQISGANEPGTWHDIHGKCFFQSSISWARSKHMRILRHGANHRTYQHFFNLWWLFSDSFLVNLDSKSKFVLLLYVKQNLSKNECSLSKEVCFCWFWPWFFRPKHLKFQIFRRRHVVRMELCPNESGQVQGSNLDNVPTVCWVWLVNEKPEGIAYGE